MSTYLPEFANELYDLVYGSNSSAVFQHEESITYYDNNLDEEEE